MGTCSYVLTGTEQGMKETFGSTCHGAVSIGIMLICISFIYQSLIYTFNSTNNTFI